MNIQVLWDLEKKFFLSGSLTIHMTGNIIYRPDLQGNINIYILYRNAIQVKNIGQTQVGHLPRNVVAKLAPLLDRRSVTVEGVINDGNRELFSFSR